MARIHNSKRVKNQNRRSAGFEKTLGAQIDKEALIRFPQGMFANLRDALLADRSREQFGIIMARKEIAPDGREVFVAQDAIVAGDLDLEASSLYSVRPRKEFIAQTLHRVSEDLTTNAIIDAHTHPFSKIAVFSGVDDADEARFSSWLGNFDDTLGYGSLLLSADAWEARVWHGLQPSPARMKTQTYLEYMPHAHPDRDDCELPEMQARTALALGVDVIRHISKDQKIVLAGVGGIGSVIAEQLARSGFMDIALIDPDVLELTNLNRFAGGFRDNLGKLKVDVAKEYLSRINPDINVTALGDSLESAAAQSLMAASDWIIVSTDSHSSRQCAQLTAIKYGVPLISAGVSIVAREENGRHAITDRSGEVIVARHGDGFCLNCLGRINHNKVAAENNPDEKIREGLVTKGYVQGMREKEPAVMPLNAIVASMATQTLLDQYRHGACHEPVVVYENHNGCRSWPDQESLDALPDLCPMCGRNVKNFPRSNL